MLSLTEVTASYGDRLVLGPLSLGFNPGTVVIVGDNGSGKSTLLRVCATLHPNSGGTLAFDGVPLTTRVALRDYRRRIGYLEQSTRFPGSVTVARSIEYSAWLFGVARADRPTAVEQALATHDLIDVRGQKLDELSGGTYQRAMIAAATVHAPSILFLDEPTGNLDPSHRAILHSALARLSSSTTIVLTSHHIDDLVAFPQRVIAIKSGSVRFDGALAAIDTALEQELGFHGLRRFAEE